MLTLPPWVCRNTVIDSNVCIGNDVSITNMYGITEADRSDTGGFMIQVCPPSPSPSSCCLLTPFAYVRDVRAVRRLDTCYATLQDGIVVILDSTHILDGTKI